MAGAVADLKKIPRKAEQAVEGPIARDIADDVIKRAKALVPVRTGRLRRSIRQARRQRFRVVRADTPYAPYVEGPPLNRRFLERAVEHAERQAPRHVERGLNRALK